MSTKESSPFNSTALVTSIERKIYLIRGQKVMLDSDLAELYGVPTSQFNQAVKRNRKRFPNDFMFQLTKSEAESLRSQFVISKKGRGGRRTAPLVFTEHGVAMLSSVLNSEQAIQVNIVIMRAFVKFRQTLETNQDLSRKFAIVIRKLATHEKYFAVVFEELRKLTKPSSAPTRRIGFIPDEKQGGNDD